MTLALMAAHAELEQPGATLRALDAALAQSPGHILFTVLINHPGLRQNQRCYSNKPLEYPVGGSKPITDSAWMRRVVHGGQPYIGRTRADIQEAFFDYELIWSLGCESVLNYPVRWRGQTVGTLSLLHRAGFYREAQVPEVALLAHLALPALLMISRQ